MAVVLFFLVPLALLPARSASFRSFPPQIELDQLWTSSNPETFRNHETNSHSWNQWKSHSLKRKVDPRGPRSTWGLRLRTTPVRSPVNQPRSTELLKTGGPFSWTRGISANFKIGLWSTKIGFRVLQDFFLQFAGMRITFWSLNSGALPQNGWCYQKPSCVRMISFVAILAGDLNIHLNSWTDAWNAFEMAICPPHFGDVCSLPGRSSDSAGSFVRIAAQRSCGSAACGIKRLTPLVDHRTGCHSKAILNTAHVLMLDTIWLGKNMGRRTKLLFYEHWAGFRPYHCYFGGENRHVPG